MKPEKGDRRVIYGILYSYYVTSMLPCFPTESIYCCCIVVKIQESALSYVNKSVAKVHSRS